MTSAAVSFEATLSATCIGCDSWTRRDVSSDGTTNASSVLGSRRMRPAPPVSIRADGQARPAAPALEDQGDDEQHEEDEQENLRDVGEVTREAAETEHTGDQGEDGKDHS